MVYSDRKLGTEEWTVGMMNQGFLAPEDACHGQGACHERKWSWRELESRILEDVDLSPSEQRFQCMVGEGAT